MIAPELRQLQQALNQRAEAIQRDFVAASERLHELGRRLVEARGVNEAPILAEQEALRAAQQALAAEVNQWRDDARAVLRQPDDDALARLLAELHARGDGAVRAAVEAVQLALADPSAAVAAREQGRAVGAVTPAGRLIERARTSYDLRGVDAAERQRAAVEFANRPGLAQDDQVLAEIEQALTQESDPFVLDVVLLTAIQLHRFRAMRLGDLDAAHLSVRRLARLKHPAVIPVLIEILSRPRTGFASGPDGVAETDNLQSRLVALGSLVEWRTAQAQNAIRARQHDRDPRMMAAATRALELFPGNWSSPPTAAPPGRTRPL
jgi:hypothetical protein